MWYIVDLRIMGFSHLYSIYASNEQEALERLKLHVPTLEKGIATVYSIQPDPAALLSAG